MAGESAVTLSSSSWRLKVKPKESADERAARQLCRCSHAAVRKLLKQWSGDPRHARGPTPFIALHQVELLGSEFSV